MDKLDETIEKLEKDDQENYKEIFEEQFKLLADISKKCEPEYLKDITNSMISIYTILNPYQ